MPNLTPLEAAEKLEQMAEHEEWIDCENPNVEPLKLAVSYLRAIAAGKYKRVVHGRWTRKYDTLSQNYNSDENWYHVCSNCGAGNSNRANYCPSCGALINEKDGSPS